MFLQPKILKFNKFHKNKIGLKPKNTGNFQLSYGMYGLKVLESCRLSAKHIETLRRSIRKIIKRTGKLWINIFPHLGVSSKPNENRMGKGKGKVDYYVSKVIAGDVIIELTGVPTRLAFKALTSASKKLPVKSCFIYLL